MHYACAMRVLQSINKRYENAASDCGVQGALPAEQLRQTPPAHIWQHEI